MSAPSPDVGIQRVAGSLEIFWHQVGGDAATWWELQVVFLGDRTKFQTTMWQPVDRGPSGTNVDPNKFPKDQRRPATWPSKQSWSFPPGTKGFVKARVRGAVGIWGADEPEVRGAWVETPWFQVEGAPAAPVVEVHPNIPSDSGGALPPPPGVLTPQ